MNTFSGSLARTACPLVALAVFALGASGCVALSRSSASLASLASAAVSLHSSSEVMFAARQEYQEDVRALAMAAVESGASGEDLLGHVGRVAVHHGITDWEVDALTYRAVGEGLALGGVDPRRARAFAEEIAGSDALALQAVLEGYES